MLVAIFGKSENWVYTGFGIYPICSRHAAEVLPLPRFYKNHKLEKKNLYEV